ncbi:hypothetical protein Tco_1479694 [Tanacetum coccineum]
MGVVKPAIANNVNFEIKSQFIRELREDTFLGNKNDDAHEHFERVLDFVSLFSMPGVTHDARYYPPSKTVKQLEDIHNFNQEGDETLYQAWERYNDILYKCPTHDLNSQHKGTSSSISNGIAAITSKLDSLGRDMKKLKENMHAIQVGCGICDGTHLNKEFPLNEEVKGAEEVKYGEFRRSFPNNDGNRARYHVGPLGYYTCVENRPPFSKKKPSLEELINKHFEESTRRRNENE